MQEARQLSHMGALQATPQSPAAPCLGVQVAEVRQLDERRRERLCVIVRKSCVNDCHGVTLVPSNSRSVRTPEETGSGPEPHVQLVRL